MSTDNYWTRRAIRRRSLLRGAGVGAVGAAGFALVGCGDDDDGGNGGETPTGGSPTATTAAGDPTATTAAAGPVAGGVAVTQSANVYDSVDPHRSVASPALQVLNRAQSKLLRFKNPNTGELESDLAETWEQPDAQTVVLKLRSGVKWQDKGPGAADPAAAAGRDFTTDDVIYNVERQKAGLLADGTEAAMGRKSYWKKVDKVEVAGDTVTFRLTQPDATFVQGLANEFNLFVQKELNEAYESSNTEIAANKVIGTGPYVITEWVPGERISAVKNPTYFLPDRPYLEAQRYVQTFEDPTAYRVAYEQKQVDSFTDPDPTTVQAIVDSNKTDMHVRYSGVANTVAIYLPRLQPPWNNDNLIKAIHLAADRRQLIQQLHNGLGKVSGPVTWLQQAWAIPDSELETTPGYRIDKEADLKEARALWEAGGGPEAGEITFVVSETWALRAGWASTPEIIAEMFNKAFGTTQFKGATKSYGEIIPAWASKNFDPFFSWIPNVEVPDGRPDLVSAFTSTSPANIWGVNDPDLDAKLAASLNLTDFDEANALLREVQDTALENGQYGRTILYNYISPAAYWNFNKGIWPGEEEGWNFLANSVGAIDGWLDQNDPSWAGRPTPDYKPL